MGANKRFSRKMLNESRLSVKNFNKLEILLSN